MTEVDSVYVVLELLIAACSVLGNVLVCWAVFVNSNLQTITNFFVVSLAAADIAVGVLAIPFSIVISTGFCSRFYGCLFIACFVLVLTQSSIFSLLAIAVDRYIAIRIPLRYNSLVTGRRAQAIIAVCWALSISIGLTPMIGWHPAAPANSSAGCPPGLEPCFFVRVVTMQYMVYFNFFGCVLLPLLLMFAIYLCIFMAARHQLQLMDGKAAAGHGEKSRSTLQKELHAATSLAIIVGLFALCWLPLHIINCFSLFCGYVPNTPVINFVIILSHANSVVNPFIYAYRIREFRHTFRKIVRRHLLGRRRPLEGESSGASAYNSSVRLQTGSVSQEAFAEHSGGSGSCCDTCRAEPAGGSGACRCPRPGSCRVPRKPLAECNASEDLGRQQVAS